jgi:hypothetical protein
MDKTTEERERIHAAISEWPPNDRPGVLVGWIVISEWMDADGSRWLGRLASEDSTRWQRKGYLHEALYDEATNWVDEDD